MNYLDNNVEAIRNFRPPFYSKLEKVLEHNQDESISMIETRDEVTALVLHREDGDIRLNSTYHPIQEAARWAQKYNMPNISSVLEMYGFGNGIFVREALKQMKPEDSIIVYEPSLSIFLYALTNYDLTDLLLDSRLLISIQDCNELNFDDYLLRKVTWYNIQSQYIAVHPQYDRAFPDQFPWFMQALQSNVERAMININTDSFLGKLSINNIMENIPYIIGSNIIADIKKQIPKNVPAIIVAAGPSLRKNVEKLKLCKGKSIIFAVDTCLKFLEEHGVEPDFIVTIDPKKSTRHFESSLVKRVPLITKLESKPEALQMHEGRKIFYSSHQYLDNIYNKLGIRLEDYTSGGSVATAAFSVCAAIGFETIVLVGQDLAFDGEYTHIGDRKQNKEIDVKIRDVEGIHGDIVKTRYDWAIYLSWFEGAIQTLHGTECIDATEGGAKIAGTKIMTLQEVIDTYCIHPFDCQKMMQELEPTLNREQLEQVSNMMSEGLKELSTIKSKAGEVISMFNKMLTDLKRKGLGSENQQLIQKIEAIGNQLTQYSVYALLDTYMVEFSRKELKDIYIMNDDQYENTKNTYSQAKDLYLQIVRSCDEVKPLLSKASQNFDHKKEEYIK